MANTLNNLIPDFYKALDVVSREVVGMIPAVQRDPSADRCALNATMRSSITPVNSAAADITPAMAIPAAAYQTIGNAGFTIQKSRYAPFSWTGEEGMSLDLGPGVLNIQQDQIAQAIRTLTNEIENDLCDYGAAGASRAYGTAGTTPFATAGDFTDLSELDRILTDNGAPESDRSFVMNTAAGAKMLGKQSSLFKVNEAGDSNFLRQGTFGNIFNFDIRRSAQINTQAAGTGANYVLNGAHAAGATSVVLKTGTGTVLAGDIITIGGFKYVVVTGVAAAGTIVIAAPGLQAAGADGDTATVNATSSRNLGFTRNSILLGTRLPALPKEGDSASDRETIIDPRSGLAFELAVYPGFRMVTYHVSLAWGVKVMKPEHLAILMG